jgi:hypothetical protein
MRLTVSLGHKSAKRTVMNPQKKEISMRPQSSRARGNVGAWGVLRSFSVLIVVPAISVSLVSSFGSGSSWLAGYGQPALLAYFLTALTLTLHGSLQHLFRVLCVINRRRSNPDRDLMMASRTTKLSGQPSRSGRTMVVSESPSRIKLSGESANRSAALTSISRWV